MTSATTATARPRTASTRRPRKPTFTPPTAMPEHASVDTIARTFELIGDPTRLRILFLIAMAENGEMFVGELCEKLAQGQPAVSHHLALIRVAGFIEGRREGKRIFYRLSDRGRAAIRWATEAMKPEGSL